MRCIFLPDRIRDGLRVMFGLVMTCCFAAAPAWGHPTLRNIAFYYGATPDIKALRRFQFAVLEPDSGFSPAAASNKKTRWLAYISVGEVASSRSYYPAIPKSWIVGHNAEWQSQVIDQSAPGWPRFFVENVVAPLWKQGYRGFFLDTLDSYQLVAKTDEQREQARKGLVAVIRAIHRRFPGAVLILNRGFELLPAVHKDVYAVAFESLFKGWSEASGKYIDVPSEARVWLLAQVNNVTQKYKLPVIAIDYCPPEDLQCSRETKRRIKALNLIPYVGDGRLQILSPLVLK